MKAMYSNEIPQIDLLTVKIDQDELDFLSYIFCEGRPVTSFVELYVDFMAGLPEPEQVVDFWAEVEGMGYLLERL